LCILGNVIKAALLPPAACADNRRQRQLLNPNGIMVAMSDVGYGETN
jgi:hypothetical protein